MKSTEYSARNRGAMCILLAMITVTLAVALDYCPFFPEKKGQQVSLTVDTEGQLHLTHVIDRIGTAEPASTVPAGLTPFFFLPSPVNEATPELLMVLPGVGPKMTERIIRFREKTGNIAGPEMFLNIQGIGEKKLSLISPHIQYKTN